MPGGGSITITVPVKLNVVGIDELLKASTLLSRIRKQAESIKVSINTSASGSSMSKREKSALGKVDESLISNQKRASNLSRTVSKDFLDLAKSTRTLISEMNKASSKMSKATSGSASTGGGSGGGGPRGPGGNKPNTSGPGGYFGSGARGDRSGGFGSRLKSVSEFAVAAKVFQAGANTLAKIPETIVGVDAELKELNKVLATSGKNLENLRKQAVATGSEFGSSITTVLKGFKVFAQQGLSQSQIVERGRSVALAENVSTLSTEEAAETVTAGLKVFGDQVGGSAERLIDSFVAVESNNAVTAADLSEVVKRVGIAAKNAGTSFDELNAFTTVIQESTRAGGGRISRSLRFTFKNLFDQARQGDLRQIGVSTRTGSGDLRDATDVLEDIAKKWNGLTRAQRRNIAVNIGGTRFQNEFNALMEDFGKVSTVAAQSQNAAGTASQRNAIIMQSITKRAAKVGASFEGFASSIGGGVTAPINAALTATEKLFNLLTSVAEIKLPVLSGIQGLLGTAKSEQTGTIGEAAGALGSSALIGLAGASLFSKGVRGRRGIQAQKAGQEIDPAMLALGAGSVTGVLSKIGGKSLGGLGAAFTKVAPMLGKFGGSLGTVGAALTALAGGPITAVIAGLGILAAVITGGIFAFNRLTESSEERDQRTGLNADIDSFSKLSGQAEKVSKAFEFADEERKTALKNLTGPENENQRKESERKSAQRERNAQKDLRDLLLDINKDEEGILNKVGISRVRDAEGKDQFFAQGVDLFSKEGLGVAKAVAKPLKNELSSLELEKRIDKSFSAFTDADKTVKQGSALLRNFTDAQDAVDRSSGATVSGLLGDIQEGLTLGLFDSELNEGPTLKQRDLLRDDQARAKVRGEFNRDISEKLVKAAEKGPEFLQKELKRLTPEGTRGGAEKAALRNLQLLAGEDATQKDARNEFNKRFLQSEEFKKAEQFGILDQLKRGTTNPFEILATSTSATSKFKDEFAQRLTKELALGARAADLQSQATSALETGVGEEVKVDATLGKDALKDVSSESVIKDLDTGQLFTKIGDQLGQTVDGVFKPLSDQETKDVLDNAAVVKFTTAILAAAQALDQVASSGFAAGQRLDIQDLDTGGDRLSSLSDQQAGAFLREKSGGPGGSKFNLGFQQVIKTVSQLEKDRKKLVDEKGDPKEIAALSKQITAATLIVRAAEAFGSSAKAIDAAARQFQAFQRERQIRSETPISATENRLMPGGFERLILGRSQSQLNANEVAQQRNPDLARRIADLQFRQGQIQDQRAQIQQQRDDVNTRIDSLSAQDLLGIDQDLIKTLFGSVGGFEKPEQVTQALRDLVPQDFDPSKATDKDVSSIKETFKNLAAGIAKFKESDLELKVEGKINADELLKSETAFQALEAFSSIQIAAKQAEQSFQNIQKSAGGIEQALSTPFRAQGSNAKRLFTGKPGDDVDQLSQVRGLERLNQFERDRREARLLSSRAVQQGRVNVFDENRQRIAPITREQANARVQDSRLNERRARRRETEQRQEQIFSSRKSQLDQVLGQVRQVQQLDLGESFKKAIDKVEQSLVGVQQNKATSFFSRGGKFNESAFNALLNVSSNLEKEISKVGGTSSIRTSELSVDQALAAKEFIGKEKAAEAVRNQVEKGGATPEQIAKAVADGVISQDEGAEFQAALNQQTYAPITSKLDIIASLVSTIAALMGANGKVDNTLKESATKEANDPKAQLPKRGGTDSGSTSTDPKVKQQTNQKIDKSYKDYMSQYANAVPPSSVDRKYEPNPFQTGQDSFAMPKSGTSGGYRSLVSDNMFAKSFGSIADKNKQLGRTAETDKQALANLLARTPTLTGSSTQQSSTQDDLFKRSSFSDRQPGTPAGLESRKTSKGETIRGTTLSEFEVQRMIDKAKGIDSLTGGSREMDSLMNRFKDSQGNSRLPQAGDFVPLDYNPFPGTGFSPFAKEGQDGKAIPLTGGEIFRDPYGTASARGIEPAGGSRSDSAMDGAVSKIQKAGESLSQLSEAANRASTAQDAKSQKAQTQQEDNSLQLRKTAKATQEQADLSHGRTTPANREQASKNRGEIDVAAIADACRQGTSEGSREGCEEGARAGTEAGATTIGREIASNQSNTGTLGGERFDALEELIVTGFLERDSQTEALQSRVDQQEEQIMSSIEDVKTQVDSVNVKTEDVRSTVEATNQRITDSESRVNDLETSMAEGAQPLEEANQRAEEAASKADRAIAELQETRNRQEEHEAHLASLEGRVAFSGD